MSPSTFVRRLAIGTALGLAATSAVTAGASAAPSDVTAWITDFGTDQRLARQPAQAWTPGSADPGRSIVVDPGQQFQRITGYGAAMTDSSAWLLTTKLDDATRTRAMTDLFSPTDGIGLSNLRVPLGASDFTADGSYTYDDQPEGSTDPDLSDFSIDHDRQTVIPRLRQAQDLAGDLNLIGSPWSPPAWMKSNTSMNGGSLLPEYEASYANYLARAATDYAAAGVDLDQLTVQNEPLNSNGGYPTMTMGPEQQRRLIADDLIPALHKAKQGRVGVLGYDHNWDVPSYPTSLLDHPNTGVDGTAWHCYGGDVVQQTVVHNAHPDAGAWLTECSGGDWQTTEADGFDGSLFAVINATREWGQGSVLWNLALDQQDGPTNGGCTNCRGVITINDDGSYTPTVDYWALGQVSSFVRPGSVRIASSTPTAVNLPNVAFNTPKGDHVLVVNNPGGRTETFSIGFGGRHLTTTLAPHAAGTYRWAGTAAAATSDPGHAVLDLGKAAVGAPSARRLVTVDAPVVDAMDQVELNGDWYAYGGPSTALPRPRGQLHQLDRTGWAASASASSADDVAQQAIDGDPATRWSSGAGMQPGDWFRLDLPRPTDIDQLVLDSTASPNDVARRYEVQISDNGTDWHPVARGTGRPSSTTIPVGHVHTRHLRVVNESSSGSWWSIHEIRALAARRTSAGPADHDHHPSHQVVRRTAQLGADKITATANNTRRTITVDLGHHTGWHIPLSPDAVLTTIKIN